MTAHPVPIQKPKNFPALSFVPMTAYRVTRKLKRLAPSLPLDGLMNQFWESTARLQPTKEDKNWQPPTRQLEVGKGFFVSTVDELGIEGYDSIKQLAEQRVTEFEESGEMEANRKGKSFKCRLNGDMYANPEDSVLTQYALQPALLNLARQYMKVPVRLHSTELHMDLPQEGHPISSQNWHYDGLDHRLTKVFTYLRDVTLETGCLHVADWKPSTHLKHRIINDPRYSKRGPERNQIVEDQIASEERHTVLGPEKTVVVADTASLIHQGLKQESQPRLMFVATYTSILPFEEWPSTPWAKLSPTPSKP